MPYKLANGTVKPLPKNTINYFSSSYYCGSLNEYSLYLGSGQLSSTNLILIEVKWENIDICAYYIACSCKLQNFYRLTAANRRTLWIKCRIGLNLWWNRYTEWIYIKNEDYVVIISIYQAFNVTNDILCCPILYVGL